MSDRISGECGCWRKSTFSNQGGCVEVRFSRCGVQVRDSKDPHRPVLEFGEAEWVAFVTGVATGEFSPAG